MRHSLKFKCMALQLGLLYVSQEQDTSRSCAANTIHFLLPTVFTSYLFIFRGTARISWG